MNQKQEKEKISTKLIILILCIVTVIAVCVSVFVLLRRPGDSGGDYAPQQIEQNDKPIPSEGSDEKPANPSGGGSVSLTYSDQVTLSLSKKEAALVFQNPARSNQDMTVEIVIDGKTIVKSGCLKPGYKVDTLSGVDTDRLSAGAYEGKFLVSYYNSETGEKAVVNTEIPIVITVKD